MKSGWQEASVGSILQLEYGKPLDEFDRKPNGRFPVYGANGEKDRTDKFYHDKPSIIVGRKGSAGEINLTEKNFWPLDVTYFVTFDERRHDLRFLYYLLSTLELTKFAKGVKPGINRNDVYAQVTKIPSLSEERRIVVILDEAFEAIAAAKANAEKSLKNARALFESHLQSIFTQRGGRVRPGWHKIKLAELAEVQSGAGFPTKFQGKVKDGIPFYKVSDMNIDGNERDMIYENNTITEDVRKNLGAHLFPKGSVIFPKIGGAIATNKKRLTTRNCCVDNNVMGATPKYGRMTSEFLYYFFLAYNLSDFANKAHLPSIKKTVVEDWELCVPKTIREQQCIVGQFDLSTEQTQRLEGIYQRKLAALEALKKSLLHQAFTGQL